MKINVIYLKTNKTPMLYIGRPRAGLGLGAGPGGWGLGAGLAGLGWGLGLLITD